MRFFTTLCALFLIFFANAAQASVYDDASAELLAEIETSYTPKFDNSRLVVEIGKGKNELQQSLAKTVEIISIESQPQAERFSAFLLLNGQEKLEVAGRFIEMVTVPALKRKISSNEAIAETDLTELEIPARKLERGYISDEQELIGKSVAHSVPANMPILSKLIKEKNLVEENKTVTLFFKNGLIEIQDMGIALESGAENDLIRVKNASSNIVISGKVVGENLIEVLPRGSLVASR